MSDPEPSQRRAVRSDPDVTEGTPLEPAVSEPDPARVRPPGIYLPEHGNVHGVLIKDNVLREYEDRGADYLAVHKGVAVEPGIHSIIKNNEIRKP